MLTIRLLAVRGCLSSQVTVTVRRKMLVDSVLARVQLGNSTLLSKPFLEFQSSAALAICSERLRAMELEQY